MSQVSINQIDYVINKQFKDDTYTYTRMLEEIVQSCYTGFGDCIVGYVSAFLFKKQLEKLYLKKDIKLTIAWNYVNCPYINTQHISKSTRQQKTVHINCLYSGEDGTLAFARYYKSAKMMYDINRKTCLRLTINQYIGKCLIDETTTRDDVMMMTYEAYKYFWNDVINQEIIPHSIDYDYDHLMTVYVRIGDQYLYKKDINVDAPLEECYQQLKNVPRSSPICLIGDVDNQAMIDVYHKLYGEQSPIIYAKGPVSHSCGQVSDDQWCKIFADLYLLLYSKEVVILTNWSNFARIVIFLRDRPDQKLYFLRNDKLELIEDKSSLFAKHYTF